MTGIIILSLMGLGLTLALAAGKKKKAGPPLSLAEAKKALERAGIPVDLADEIERRAEEMTIAPGLPPAVPKTPRDPGLEPEYDWSGWIASKIMAAMTSHSVDGARAAAHALEAQAAQPGVPADARSLMIQGAAALRSAALSWEQELAAAKVIPVGLPKTWEPYLPPGYGEVKEEPKFQIPTMPEELPSLEDISRVVKHTAEKTLAIAVTNMLNQNGGAPDNRYKEDRNMVKAYQAQEGLTPDGLYGVGTGLSVVGYNIIPAKPYYFSKTYSKMLASKARWKDEMLRMARIDPARALQWQAASDVRSL